MTEFPDVVKAPKFIGDGSELSVADVKLADIRKALDLIVPIGTIVAYAGPVHEGDIGDGDPNEVKAQIQQIRTKLDEQGWRVCDGSEVKIEEYKELYSAIGCAFGGDTNTYFNMPDLRGRFIRGVDHGVGVDPDAAVRMTIAKGGNKGDAVGSVQEDAFAKHTHTAHQISFGDQHIYSGGRHGKNNVPTGEAGQSTETRPRNLYVNWIIKAKHIL